MGERYYVDVLLPGFIEADSGIKFGAPCLIGTGIPHYVGLGWVWESLENPANEELTREQIIALGAFQAGYEWHRSRKRRKKMDDAVTELWDRITVERDYGPGYEEA